MISARTLPTTALQPRPSLPPHQRVGEPADFDALVVSGARWVLLLCAVWAALIVVAAGVELVSGGRTRALTWVAAPPWVRRLVLSLLGATLVGVPATAGLATAAPASPVGPAGSSTSHLGSGSTGPDGWDTTAGPDGLPVPSRPAVQAPPVPGPTPSEPPTRTASGRPEPSATAASPGAEPTRAARPTPSPTSTRRAPATPPARTGPSATPSTGAPGSGSAGSTRSGGSHGPADAGSASPEPAPGSAEGDPAAGLTRVVVRPGDCLWDIAVRRLPPGASRAEVAATVTRLHALNRRLIGPDPDLLRPGQRLAVPRRL